MVLSKIFSNNMILQRNKSTLLRGEGKAGEVISATIADKKCSAIVGDDGWFEMELPEFEAGGPYEMRVSSDNGQDDILITGILFGDVYLLGGQSNMELTIGMIPDNNEQVLNSAVNDNIRMFQVPKEYDFSGKVRNITSGEWKAVSTDTVADFSAIGYFFAQLKYADDKVPVGLVHTAIGGSPIESLMSEENLLSQAEKIRKTHDIKGQCDNNKNMGCIFCYEKLLERVKQPGYIENTVKEDLKRIADWHKALDDNDEGLKAGWMNSLLYTDETIDIPGSFLGTKYEDYIGSLWLQRTVNIPESFIGKEALLSLGTLVDFDTAYVNGVEVGATEYKYPQRRYTVASDLLRAGENLITVRLGMDSNIGGAIPDMPYCLILGEEKIDLTGSWKIKEGARADKLEGETFFVWNPTAQFNSNIAPLKGYGFDAVFFYQGESNSGRPEYYGELMIAMVDEWRSLFGELPFYVAELAYYLGDGPVYADDPFAGVREVQRQVVPKIKDAYLIPVCDLGQYNELHPQNKDEVAARFYEEYKKHR